MASADVPSTTTANARPNDPKSDPSEDEPEEDAELLLKSFFADIRDTDRTLEVERVLGAFKLNPYEYLNVPFDADDAAIKRAFRKSSLVIHPDKCKHEHAKDAFEALGAAYKVLTDETRKASVDAVLNYCKELVSKEWGKTAAKDGAMRMRALVASQRGEEYDFTTTPEFHNAWKAKAREVMAQAEWRKRKQALRIKDEEGRQRELEEEQRDARKQKREAVAQWEKGRESRVDTWRGFHKGGGQSGGSSAAAAGAAAGRAAGSAAGSAAAAPKKSTAGPRRGVVGAIKPPKVRMQ